MTRLEALKDLKDLKAKVEAGEDWHYDEFDPDGWLPLSWLDAFYGSLDAAKALHDAVLPDVRVQGVWETTEGSWVARLCLRAHATQVGYAVSTTPARAWLLAILNAMIAERTAE
jgi:hypothetical protein